MNNRTGLEEERRIDWEPPPLVMLPGYLGYQVAQIAEGVSRELARGTPPDAIASYLEAHNRYRQNSLEHALWVATTDWLSRPFVPDPLTGPGTSDEPGPAEKGGPSCLIV